MKRIIDYKDGVAKWHASEDGKTKRIMGTDIDAVVRDVRRLDDKMNKAAPGNSGWRFVGKVPFTLILEWCNDNGYTLDQWARNEDNAKKKFLKYFQSREFHRLRAH